MKIYGYKEEIISKIKTLDKEKKYICEVKEPKSKRSLEQNKLLWKLVDKIAKHTKQDDIAVYCAALERANALSDYVITATNMEDSLREQFRGVKFIRKQEINGKECNVYKVYLGSSKMSVKEMNELLEIVFQICSELEIATMEDFYE